MTSNICVAFLGNKPTVLCKCKATYQVGNKHYCGKHKNVALRNLETADPLDGVGNVEPGTDDCAICSEPMRLQRTLPCGHSFHPKCISNWTGRKASCPMCRVSISVPKHTDQLSSILYTMNNLISIKLLPKCIECAEAMKAIEIGPGPKYAREQKMRLEIKKLLAFAWGISPPRRGGAPP